MEDSEEKLAKPSGSERVRSSTIVKPSANDSSVKELWQMTKAEYEEKYGRLRTNTTVTGRFSPHMSAVETALNRGLPVPPKVLADYPSLS